MRWLTYPTVVCLVACLTLLYPPLDAQAQWVNRCEDPNGQITFTAGNCPAGTSLGYQHAYAQNPGTRLPAAPPKQPRATPAKPRPVVAPRTQANARQQKPSAAPKRAANTNTRKENIEPLANDSRTGKKYLPARTPEKQKEKS